MKAYILLNQDIHSAKIFHEDKRKKKTFIKGDKLESLDKGIVNKLFRKPSSKYVRVHFSKKEAASNILHPSIVESLRRSFEAYRKNKTLHQYQMKAFFVLKTINVALNTRVKVYSCHIDREDIVNCSGGKYISSAVNIKEEKISMGQLKSAIKKAIPPVYEIIDDASRISKLIPKESISESVKAIIASFKGTLREIPLNQIDNVSYIIDLINLSKELEENEK